MLTLWENIMKNKLTRSADGLYTDSNTCRAILGHSLIYFDGER